MKTGTRVRVTRFNETRANGKVTGKPRVGRRGAWYPVTLDDGTVLMCRLGQLKEITS